MRRLLWKEWKERWLWIALWIVTGAVTTALGKGQFTCGEQWQTTSSWMFVIPLTAMLAGLGGYGSELHGGRATFLYSRPVTWKQLLAAKLLLGFVAVIGSGIVSALAGCLLLPEEYHSLITPHSLAVGALIMAGFTAGAYLLGLAFSTVLPGVAGGLLVLVGWMAVVTTVAGLSIYKPVFSLILFIFSPLIAGFILIRFGITLHSAARLRRFILTILTIAALGFILDRTPLATMLVNKINSWGSKVAQELFRDNNFSPDARYVYLNRYVGDELVPCLVRLSDGRFSFLDSSISVGWLANGDSLAAYSGIDTKYPRELHVLQWHGQELRTLRIKNSGYLGLKYHALSPDGRRLLVGGETVLQFCDLTTGETHVVAKVDRAKLRRMVRRDKGRLNGLFWCWWQSTNEVGYLDPFTKKRVLIQLSECGG